MTDAPSSDDDVLLTGATGYVGSFLCRQLLLQRRRVVCFVRRGDSGAMRSSVSEQQRLSSEEYPPRLLAPDAPGYLRFRRSLARTLDPSADPAVDDLLPYVDVVEVNYTAAGLGLTADTAVVERLRRVGLVLHCAANTSQVLSYELLREANLATHLLAWCCAQTPQHGGRLRRVGWISTLGVFPARGGECYDERSAVDELRGHLDTASGYVQSKWLADCLFRRVVAEGLLPAGGAVFRLGLIGPPSFGSGYCNAADWLTRLTASCSLLGCRPAALSLFSVNMLPVDLCAAAIVHLFLAPGPATAPAVYHLMNTAGTTDVAAFFAELPVLPLPDWLQRAEQHPDLPITPLLDAVRSGALSAAATSLSAHETTRALADTSLSLAVHWNRSMYRGH